MLMAIGIKSLKELKDSFLDSKVYTCFKLVCNTAFIETIFVDALDYSKLCLIKKNW